MAVAHRRQPGRGAAIGWPICSPGFLARLKHDLPQRSNADIDWSAVRRRDDGPDVEERYVITHGGAVEVTLTTRPDRLSRTFRLERHVLAGV